MKKAKSKKELIASIKDAKLHNTSGLIGIFVEDIPLLLEALVNYDIEEQILEEKPILIGYLNKKFGYNHYYPIEIGTPVYSFKDRYYFEMGLIKNNQTHRQSFYKDSLKDCIDFIKNDS